jgi:hypothetical protein
VVIDFDEDDGERKPDSKQNAASNSRKSAPSKKAAKENKKKKKIIIMLSAVSVIVVFFVVLIVIAASNPDFFNRTPEQTTTSADTSASTPPTTEGTTSATTDDSGTPSVEDERQVANFLDFRARERHNFMDELRTAFDSFEFDFVPEYNDDHPYGTLLEQSIAAGEIVPVGSEITIKYSLGREFVPLPDFAGQTAEEYQAALRGIGVASANIQVVDRELPEHTPELEGVVIGVSFGVGNVDIPAGTNVRIVDFPGDDARRANIIAVYRAVLPPPPETTVTTRPPPEFTTRPPPFI